MCQEWKEQSAIASIDFGYPSDNTVSMSTVAHESYHFSPQSFRVYIQLCAKSKYCSYACVDITTGTL